MSNHDVLVFDGENGGPSITVTTGGGGEGPIIVPVPSASTEFVLVTSGTPGAKGDPGPGLPAFTLGGVLETRVGNGAIYNDTGRNLRILKARASLAIPSTGSPVVVAVKRSGVTVATVTVPPGAQTAAITPTDDAWAPDQYLTVDIVQVGSEFPGDTLVVTVATA